MNGYPQNSKAQFQQTRGRIEIESTSSCFRQSVVNCEVSVTPSQVRYTSFEVQARILFDSGMTASTVKYF